MVPKSCSSSGFMVCSWGLIRSCSNSSSSVVGVVVELGRGIRVVGVVVELGRGIRVVGVVVR